MIIEKNKLLFEERKNIRGGNGKAKYYSYLKEGDLKGVKFVSLIELEPFASVGEHPHNEDEELYFIVEGSGSGILNGKVFRVEKEDAFLCQKGQTHGIKAGENGLTFLAVLAG